jgi:catechol 2,3-dioxygenase-like lactoylglutathione lyase family enzyme
MGFGVRLRQAVLVVHDRDAACARLGDGLGLHAPFHDENVGLFGLHNAVYALGDDFLEIVSPIRDGTAAGRELDRRGEGGYMLLFQVDDLTAARRRAAALGVRAVWGIDLNDIAATHLHPGDVGGTIVSIDRPDPPESWRWGGPEWTGQAGTGAPGRLTGATVRVAEPERTAARWGEVLGLTPDGAMLRLDGDQHVRFEAGDDDLAEIAVELPTGPAAPLAFGRARVIRA